MNKNLKVGSNKGRSRVWLDGKYLNDIGFVRGARYNVLIASDKDGSNKEMILILDEKGPRMVAGKGDKPIIDLCNNTVSDLFGEFERVNVKLENNHITIEGV